MYWKAEEPSKKIYVEDYLPKSLKVYSNKNKILVISSIHKLGIVHRDIKLENILVGDEYDLCIADLGFACVGFDDKGI